MKCKHCNKELTEGIPCDCAEAIAEAKAAEPMDIQIQKAALELGKISVDMSDAVAHLKDTKNVASIDEEKIKRMIADAAKASEAERMKNVAKTDTTPTIDQMRLMNQNKREFNTSAAAQKDAESVMKTLNEVAPDAMILSVLLNTPISQLKTVQNALGEVGCRILRKAMDTQEAGNGLEFVQTGYANTVIDQVLARNVILAIPEVVKFNMPTKIYKPPIGANEVAVYHTGEPTSDSASNITASDAGTADITFTAADLAALVYASSDLTEDSVAPMLPYISLQISRALSDTVEKIIMRGDERTGGTDNINKNDGSPAAGTYYLAMDGMAKLCIDASGNSFDIATLLAEDITASAATLDKYALNPQLAPIVCDTATYYKMLLLKDTNNNLVLTTRDKYGDNAAIITGELAKVFGFPILPSGNYVKTTEGELGEITTAGGTLKGGFFQFYSPGVYWGWRRNITLEMEKNIKTQQYAIVGTLRGDVQFPFGLASVNMGYDRD